MATKSEENQKEEKADSLKRNSNFCNQSVPKVVNTSNSQMVTYEKDFTYNDYYIIFALRSSAKQKTIYLIKLSNPKAKHYSNSY